jgi:hypothetical protein
MFKTQHARIKMARAYPNPTAAFDKTAKES